MASLPETYLVGQLQDRRQRLETAIAHTPEPADFVRLLGEVDAALQRVESGTYGLCETCHDPVEPERLLTDPLLRYCLDHLTPEEQRALQQDLELAARIQRGLLPAQHLEFDGWQVHYRYQPAGPVSGDYCDVVRPDEDSGELFFLFGDVSGKGVAAAILMAHLHATFRNLLAVDRAVDRLVERANRVFRESALAPYFATLVCGRATRSGEIEICNAGHCPPLVLSAGGMATVEPTGLPVGVFYSTRYASRRVSLAPGDTLVLYTDGLTEARNRFEEEYGTERLMRVLAGAGRQAPPAVLEACIRDLTLHLGGMAMTDDLSLMILRRAS